MGSMVYNSTTIEPRPSKTKKKRIVSSKYMQSKGFVPPSNEEPPYLAMASNPFQASEA